MDWDDDDRDVDGPDDESDRVAPCPSCGAEISQEAERCPRCGDWVLDAPAGGGWPLWMKLGAVLALVVVGLWLVGWLLGALA